MESKNNYIRKEVVISVEKAIVNIFNCNERPGDLSVVDVINTAKEIHNLNVHEEKELYLFVQFTQQRFMRFFNVIISNDSNS